MIEEILSRASLTRIGAKRTDENYLHGCSVDLWLEAKETNEGYLMYYVSSDSRIVTGTALIILDEYQLKTPQEILDQEADFTIFEKYLSLSRRNALSNLPKRIREIACEFLKKN